MRGKSPSSEHIIDFKQIHNIEAKKTTLSFKVDGRWLVWKGVLFYFGPINVVVVFVYIQIKKEKKMNQYILN